MRNGLAARSIAALYAEEQRLMIRTLNFAFAPNVMEITSIARIIYLHMNTESRGED